MRYHEILITFMRATQVPPSGVVFFNTLKEFTLLQNASGRQADIRTLPDVFFTGGK